MGLHVRPLRAEQLPGPVDSELLDLVDDLAAPVVPLAGIAFGVLVGEHAAGGGHNLFGGEVLGGDQLEPVTLTLLLEADQLEDALIAGAVANGLFWFIHCHGRSIPAGARGLLPFGRPLALACRSAFEVVVEATVVD